jgi:hypothetical protein
VDLRGANTPTIAAQPAVGGALCAVRGPTFWGS